jgi:hypothetical protein
MGTHRETGGAWEMNYLDTLDDDSVRPPSRRRLLLAAGVLVIGLLCLGLGVRFLVLGVFGDSIEAEFERIRAAGEPVYPEEIVVTDPGPGEDALEWLAGWEKRREERCDWSMDALRDPLDMLGYAQGVGVELARLEPLEDLARLFEEGGFDEDRWEDLLFLSFPDALNDAATPLSEEHRTVLRAMAAGLPFTDQDLEEIGRLGGIDHARLFEGMREEEYSSSEQFDSFPGPSAIQYDLWDLGNAAIVSAQQGRFEEALDRLDLAFRAAEMSEGGPAILTGYGTWSLLAWSAVSSVVPTVAALPSGTSLDAVDARLAALDPRAQLMIAMEGERTIINRIFQWLGQCAEFSLPVPEAFEEILGGVIGQAALDRDQLFYLGLMREGMEMAEMGGPEYLAHRREYEVREEEFPWGAVISSIVAQTPEDWIDGKLELEARILLTRGALVAHRDGVEAGISWISGQVDPFDGKPLRHRVEEDGTTVYWSVGVDGVDDGAVAYVEGEEWLPEPDVVLRFRFR